MIDLSSLQAIFFDADDTLYSVNGSVGERYAIHLEAHGHRVTPQEVDRVVPIAWGRLIGTYENHEGNFVTDHDRDRRIWFEYVNYVMEELQLSAASDELFQDIYDEFGKAESRALHPHVESLLKKLREFELTLGVLTNNDRRIHQLIEGLGLDAHFDHVFCAADIGYKKPSKMVFDGVSEKIGIVPEKILYIGDCPKNDIQGGEQAGWNVLWYDRDGRQHLSDTRRVSCFGELIEVLEKARATDRATDSK